MYKAERSRHYLAETIIEAKEFLAFEYEFTEFLHISGWRLVTAHARKVLSSFGCTP